MRELCKKLCRRIVISLSLQSDIRHSLCEPVYVCDGEGDVYKTRTNGIPREGYFSCSIVHQATDDVVPLGIVSDLERRDSNG